MDAGLKMSAFVLQNGQVSFSEDLRLCGRPQGLHQLYVFVKAQNYQWPPHRGYLKQQVSLKIHLTFPKNLVLKSRKKQTPK
jgi:hypothetical protein